LYSESVGYIYSFITTDLNVVNNINPLNAELDPTCYLLALLGAHHILHVSRIRVNGLSRTLNVITLLIIIGRCFILTGFFGHVNKEDEKEEDK
jgi:hypothetical protein